LWRRKSIQPVTFLPAVLMPNTKEKANFKEHGTEDKNFSGGNALGCTSSLSMFIITDHTCLN
jgi:hypothetical protein